VSVVEGVRKLMGRLEELEELALKLYKAKAMWDVYCRVFRAFESLKPLRRGCVEVCEFKKRFAIGAKVVVGSWFRVRAFYYRRGRLVDDASTLFEIIKHHGREVAPYVRGAVRPTFERMVELVEGIVDVNELGVRKELDVEIRMVDRARGGWLMVPLVPVRGVEIYMADPHYVKITHSDEEWTTIKVGSWDLRSVSVIEGLFEVIRDAYLELLEEVERVRARNLELLKVIEKVCLPFRAAAEFA